MSVVFDSAPLALVFIRPALSTMQPEVSLRKLECLLEQFLDSDFGFLHRLSNCEIFERGLQSIAIMELVSERFSRDGEASVAV